MLIFFVIFTIKYLTKHQNNMQTIKHNIYIHTLCIHVTFHVHLLTNCTCCLQNYDREEEAGTPAAVVNWINAVIAGEHDPIVSSLLLW